MGYSWYHYSSLCERRRKYHTYYLQLVNADPFICRSFFCWLKRSTIPFPEIQPRRESKFLRSLWIQRFDIRSTTLFDYLGKCPNRCMTLREALHPLSPIYEIMISLENLAVVHTRFFWNNHDTNLSTMWLERLSETFGNLISGPADYYLSTTLRGSYLSHRSQSLRLNSSWALCRKQHREATVSKRKKSIICSLYVSYVAKLQKKDINHDR